MENSARYVLGIDGLPLGSHAAVARGDKVSTTFVVGDVAGRAVQHLGLDMHVRTAVAQATTIIGHPIDDVRLVCVDDGTTGAALDDLSQWLATDVGATLEVLDLVFVNRRPTGPEADGGNQTDVDLRSMRRACSAALWR